MEIEYRREARKTFLQLAGTKTGTGYEERMMQHIRQASLLPFHVSYEGTEKRYCYEISSLQPLERLAVCGKVTEEVLTVLILQLDHALSELEKYMLPGSDLLLLPQTVYLEPEEEKVQFCAVPEGGYSFAEQMQALCLFLLPHLTAGSEAVLLCHRMYQASFQENFSSGELLRFISEKSEGCKRKAAETELIRAVSEAVPKEVAAAGENAATGFGGMAGREAIREGIGEPEEGFAGGGKETTDRARFSFSGWRGKLPQIAVCLAILCAAPAIVFLLRGSAAVLRMLPVFCAVDIGLVLYLLLNHVERGKRREMTEEEYPEIPEALPEENYRALAEAEAFPAERQREGMKEWEMEKPFPPGRQSWEHEKQGEEQHSLIPFNKALPSILLDHFPFVIGKNKKTADFALQDERVSRMHLQFHKEGDAYYMTDLNSANGTKLGEYLLNANETVQVQPGQEISIAGIGYVFM